MSGGRKFQTTSLQGDSGIDGPKCGKRTTNIVVDVNRVDWPSFFLIGIAAVLYPSLARKELQCEHCGKIFSPASPPASKSDRTIGLVLAGFSVLMVLLVIWVVFFGMAGLSGR